ncbi:Calcium/calmodulin-dependent protein kinase type IV, partial [Lamellibrachia satsuma]
DIIQRLLVLDPKKCLSAIRALNHPWVTGKAARRIPLHETQSCMKTFNATRKIKAGVAAVIAFNPRKLSLMTEEVRPTSSPADTNNLSATSSGSESRSSLDATDNSNA